MAYDIHIETWDVFMSSMTQALKIHEELGELMAEIWEGETEGEQCDILQEQMIRIEDELADVIQATANLAHYYGMDLAEVMDRCTERQRERGRL